MRLLIIFVIVFSSMSVHAENYVYLAECEEFIRDGGNSGQCYYDKDTLSYPYKKKKLLVNVTDKSYIRVWIKQEFNNKIIMMLNLYSCSDRTVNMEDCQQDGKKCVYGTPGMGNLGGLIALQNRNIAPGTFDEKALKVFCK